jgi:hypothetical protein
MADKNYGDIVVPLKVSVEKLWSEVMGGGWEYMPWWSEVKYLGDAEWNIPGSFEITTANPDDDDEPEITKTFNIDDLARGYALAVSTGFHHCGAALSLDDMDSCSSDGILQLAFFGELVYG